MPTSFVARQRPERARTAGFTLLELVAVIVILGVVAATVAQPLARAIEAQGALTDSGRRKADADYALGRMVNSVIASPAVTCSTTGAAEMTAVTPAGERRFFVENGALLLEEFEGGASLFTEPLLDDVAALPWLCEPLGADLPGADLFRLRIETGGFAYEQVVFRRPPVAAPG